MIEPGEQLWFSGMYSWFMIAKLVELTWLTCGVMALVAMVRIIIQLLSPPRVAPNRRKMTNLPPW